MADPKKISSSMRPIIESILKKAAGSGNISQEVLEKRIKELDLIDAGKKIDNKKKGGQMKKKKKKKSFPDMDGDGKVTKKDILIGRGVIKKAKMGMQMKGTSPLLKKRK
jgi:Zn-dependent peptidase ImmA (M78 family)